MFIYSSINKYNDTCKENFKKLGIKTKPEPWLHIAVMDFTHMPEDKELGIKAHDGAIYWCIYVWDTREVLEFGEAPKNTVSMYSLSNYSARSRFGRIVHVPKAKDNLQPLKGDNQIINAINKHVIASRKRK